jgi:hypothetical protein
MPLSSADIRKSLYAADWMQSDGPNTNAYRHLIVDILAALDCDLLFSNAEIALLRHLVSVAAWIRMEQIHCVTTGEYPMDLTQGFQLDFARAEQKQLGPILKKLDEYCQQHNVPLPDFIQARVKPADAHVNSGYRLDNGEPK